MLVVQAVVDHLDVVDEADVEVGLELPARLEPDAGVEQVELGVVALGHPDAADELYGRIYAELKEIAHRHLRRNGGWNTMGTTALVHETYLRLVAGADIEPTDRAHFLAIASRTMRFVLIDEARARAARKRGGDRHPVTLERMVGLAGADGRGAEELIALDRALEALAERDRRLADVVDYRFFGGMTHEEIAEVTGRSVPTVKRDWRRARTWLYAEMTGETTPSRTGS